ncbi:uncharacterized protein LOC119986883 [Tripterygium wilfordii]|uniref:uncharacterized protein LOC119986883 n=1 Tax=Tripterygium wilfordii TaxID=458696 RepID=UPI0018F7EED0|nr:uncharacterized protein LOC119986883 [Tripterygium wilfordii]
MRWHYEHQSESNILCHPSDEAAWKHFDRTYRDFASDPRNIRLGLCTDGFTPFEQSGKNYSCWPIILTPYNLPPGICMKREFMLLTVIIPGPQNPKSKIDVYLQPLIDELNQLWCEGVTTYDVRAKENFVMRAALMWTINVFPAYGMLSGWMTQGKLACPCCMERSKAFTLKNGRKNSWFDCHRQFLDTTHPFRRNKDAFLKNRIEISEPPPYFYGEEVLARSFRVGGMAMAKLSNRKQKRVVCHWVSSLKLLDGYASNLGRCVDMREGKLFGMKSHDCHVFMERLLPIAFRALSEPIWAAITELSHFCRDICSTTLREDQLTIMEVNIPMILCKLERIFPPSFFDSMEHLLIHLPFEARMGGPVQYRWMYPFERFLHFLKKNVKNKSRVEGSICEAYIVEETSTFASYYFEPHVTSRRTRVPRNDEGGTFNPEFPTISIFNQPGRLVGEAGRHYLTDKEYDAATLYMFLNCDIVQPFIKFCASMSTYVYDPQNMIEDELIRDVSRGPLRRLEIWNTYYVNGYKFDTDARSEGKSTINSGVCIRGTDYGQSEYDYYGILKEIVQLDFFGLPKKNCSF